MKIPFSPPDITEQEAQEVTAALLSGWITTGPRTKKLESEIANLCGVDKAVCLSSATACLESILQLLGIGPGDEVITSAYTYTATASVVCHIGATLRFVDTQKDSLEMDYDQMADAINERTFPATMRRCWLPLRVKNTYSAPTMTCKEVLEELSWWPTVPMRLVPSGEDRWWVRLPISPRSASTL